MTTKTTGHVIASRGKINRNDYTIVCRCGSTVLAKTKTNAERQYSGHCEKTTVPAEAQET